MTDPNVEYVRKVFEEYEHHDLMRRVRMREFTKRVNEDLDRLTPTRRTDAATTA